MYRLHCHKWSYLFKDIPLYENDARHTPFIDKHYNLLKILDILFF